MNQTALFLYSCWLVIALQIFVKHDLAAVFAAQEFTDVKAHHAKSALHCGKQIRKVLDLHSSPLSSRSARNSLNAYCNSCFGIQENL